MQTENAQIAQAAQSRHALTAEQRGRLRAARLALGLSQQEAASRARLALFTVNKVERTGAIGVRSLVALARIYGLSLDGMLIEDPGAEAP